MPKVTSKDYRDDQLKIYAGQQGHLRLKDGYASGAIHTDYGTVEVMIYKSDKRPYTILQTALNGYRYIRQWDRAFSTTYAKTLCKRFMKELIKEN